MNNRSLNNDSDEDGTNENAFLTSILSILNGYCKINLEVQQVNLFYSNDSLLPINAKVNSNTYNNIHKVQSVQKLRSNTNILKNEENIESACQSNSLNKPSNAEFQMYSKPFNYHSILNTDKNTNVVPKGTKKNNNNIFIRPSTLDNQLDNLSLRTDQNVSNDINISQCDDENVEFGLQSQQDKVKYYYLYVEYQFLIIVLFIATSK